MTIIYYRFKTNGIIQHTQQTSHLATRSSPVQVEFIDNDVKNSVLFSFFALFFRKVFCCQPTSGIFKHLAFCPSHKHNAEHRSIGNHNIRYPILHIPTGYHLAGSQISSKSRFNVQSISFIRMIVYVIIDKFKIIMNLFQLFCYFLSLSVKSIQVIKIVE